ncbi:MAG: hypothetical protein KC613_28375, partial [Myxococcales bacterium]|nr:hypothetical protein [Myxococcales bacterium]
MDGLLWALAFTLIMAGVVTLAWAREGAQPPSQAPTLPPPPDGRAGHGASDRAYTRPVRRVWRRLRDDIPWK